MDVKKLADLICDHEVAVMTANGSAWLTREQRAAIFDALREREYVLDQDKLLKAQEHAIACGNLTLELQSALGMLTNACAEAGWPKTAEQMAPMNMARAALNKRLDDIPQPVALQRLGPATCDRPGDIFVTMTIEKGEWYCHGCGANQDEPACRYKKSATDSATKSTERMTGAACEREQTANAMTFRRWWDKQGIDSLNDMNMALSGWTAALLLAPPRSTASATAFTLNDGALRNSFEAWFKTIPNLGFPTVDAQKHQAKELMWHAWRAAPRSVASAIEAKEKS